MSLSWSLCPVTLSPMSGLCDCRVNTCIPSSWEAQTSVLSLDLDSLSDSPSIVSIVCTKSTLGPARVKVRGFMIIARPPHAINTINEWLLVHPTA